MLDIIPSISAVVAAIGVIVGVAFTVLELRNLVKARQTDLVLRLYSTYGSKEFQEASTKLWTGEFKNLEDFLERHSVEAGEVGFFFEGVGVLLHRKLIDIGLVDDLFSTPIKMTWERMKSMEEALRRQFNRPQIGEWFEYLYDEMQKREQRLQQ